MPERIELSCPNCGAADSAPSQHGTRICRFCGTHFKVEKPATAANEQEGQRDIEKRQWRNLGILVAVFCTIVGLLFLLGYIWLVEREEAKPDNRSDLQKMVDDFERRGK